MVPTSKNVKNRERKKCPCAGYTLERLVRPALLMVLLEGDLYGYKIVQKLSQMPMFKGTKPNAAGVYRCLKSLTEEGVTVFAWELSESGPAKRMYSITSEGKNCLNLWMETLANYRTGIDELLKIGKAIIGASGKKTSSKCKPGQICD